MAQIPFNYNVNNSQNDDVPDHVALFIDWDNLVISNYADRGANRPNLDVIIAKAQQYGTVVVARAYAEWLNMQDRLEVYKTGVETIYAPVFHAERDLSGQTSKGKSLADPVMVTDCIDFLHLLPSVGTYVMVTGDKDMIPVVRIARLRGRRVVVIGPDYVANILQQMCDEFIPYRVLLAQAANVDPMVAYYQQQQQQAMVAQMYAQQQGANVRAGATTAKGRLANKRGAKMGQPYASVNVPPPPPPPSTNPQPYSGYYSYNTPYTAPQGYTGTPTTPPYASSQAGYSSSTPATPSYGQYYPSQYPTAQTGTYPPYAAQPYTAPETTYTPSPTPGTTPTYSYTTPSATPPVAPVETVTPVVTTPTPAPVTPPTPSARGNSFDDIKEIVQAILTQRAAAGRGQIRARDLKEEILRRIPNFNERRFGFNKFKNMLTTLEQAGVVQIDQDDHIVWVSLPGTSKVSEPKVTATTLSPDYAEDFGEESESDIEESVTEFLEAAVAATEVVPPLTDFEVSATGSIAIYGEESVVETIEEEIAPPVDVVTEAATVEAVPEMLVASVAEERKTSLVEAPIGAHRSRTQAQPVNPFSKLGAKPALLDQPHFEDVIVLIESLRHRNRWLGYELLLSNVRDYLTKQGMSESDAKTQAGSILSRLLSENVLKMAIEVHSRGARKMRVQVAHLQEDNKAVKYALAAAKIKQEQPDSVQVVPELASIVEEVTEVTPSIVELYVPEALAAVSAQQLVTPEEAQRATVEPDLPAPVYRPAVNLRDYLPAPIITPPPLETVTSEEPPVEVAETALVEEVVPLSIYRPFIWLRGNGAKVEPVAEPEGEEEEEKEEGQDPAIVPRAPRPRRRNARVEGTLATLNENEGGVVATAGTRIGSRRRAAGKVTTPDEPGAEGSSNAE